MVFICLFLVPLSPRFDCRCHPQNGAVSCTCRCLVQLFYVETMSSVWAQRQDVCYWNRNRGRMVCEGGRMWRWRLIFRCIVLYRDVFILNYLECLMASFYRCVRVRVCVCACVHGTRERARVQTNRERERERAFDVYSIRTGFNVTLKHVFTMITTLIIKSSRW